MRKELGNIKEPTDFEGTVKELAEQVLDLSTKQPDGMIHDADTILADIMEAADFQVSGISDDIIKLYLEVENKDDFESLFYLLTGVTFEYYLHKCEGTIQRNVAETELRIIQIYLFKSNKSRKNSLIIQTDAPKNKIRTCLRNGYSLSLLSMDCGIKNIVNNLQEMGYIVRILYAPNGKFDKIKRFSCKEKYNLADYDMKYVLYHEKVVMELYNKVFCQNLKNPKSLTLEILEGTANQLGIFAIEINQFYILTDDATRFSLGYRDFRKIVNYYGYRIYRKTTASGDECYRFVFSEKLLEHYN